MGTTPMHTCVSGIDVCVTLLLLMGNACTCDAYMHACCHAMTKLRLSHCNVLAAVAWEDALGGRATLRMAMTALQVVEGLTQESLKLRQPGKGTPVPLLPRLPPPCRIALRHVWSAFGSTRKARQ